MIIDSIELCTACHAEVRGSRSVAPSPVFNEWQSRKKRPACGAQNRQAKPCAVKVEPDKRRCRFHGGLSTGPKTAAGRARIAEAQRRRWERLAMWSSK